MPTIPFSIRLDADLKSRLEAEAKLEDRSIAYVTQKAIDAYLGAKEAKRAAIRAAVAEAEKGYFVSEEKAHAWIASWDTQSELPMPVVDIVPARRR